MHLVLGKKQITSYGAMSVLVSGASVDAAKEDGWTALTIAAEEGHKDIVDLLLDKGLHSFEVD